MTRHDAIKLFAAKYSLSDVSKHNEDDDDAWDMRGCRGGQDGLFEPRSGVEDDDCPDFNGGIVEKYFKTLGFKVGAYDHEKGWFTVEFYN